MNLAKLIRIETLKVLKDTKVYTDEVISQLLNCLKIAQKDIGYSVLNCKIKYPSSKNVPVSAKGLEIFNKELEIIIKQLVKKSNLILKRNTLKASKLGIKNAANVFIKAKEFNKSPIKNINTVIKQAYALLDEKAVDFLTRYTLTLAGDVSQQLKTEIKKIVLSNLISGSSIEDTVKALGKIIKDKESFRHAGGRVFPSAQNRMETIVRTETMRAHNMGQLRFNKSVGVKKVEWLCVKDERSCPKCKELDGKIFNIDSVPALPLHPNCGCTVLALFDDL